LPRRRFAAVYGRLDRAHAHYESLDAAIADYTARPPYLVTIGAAESPDRVVVRVDLVEDPPREIGMILSDLVHQARAALDNLIGEVRPGGPTSTSSFPLRETEETFARAAKDALAGVPEWVETAVRDLQPFSALWFGDELLELHRVARSDRHRAPILQAAFLEPFYVESYDGANVEMRGDLETWAEVEFTPDNGREVRPHWQVEVRFASNDGELDRLPVLSSAESWLRTVEAVVHEIERRTPRVTPRAGTRSAQTGK
jgi:hypothetical protein